ncbi:hypothetical protein [Micromonospora sp. SH-82]|uniref:hypothetical protein n=1 Tax=Micromonospora sp. SH-82 TaxID=3132938 RepID=UPI003EBBD372
MSTGTHHGRPLVSRAEAAELLGISVSHLDRLYRDRYLNGFPDRADDDRSWFADDIRAYVLPRDQAWNSTDAKVDRTGDPDELVDATTIARMLGYRSRASLTGQNRMWSLLLHRVDDESLTPTGRKRRRWKRSTVWELAGSRTGKGAPHTGRPAGTPHGQPDRSGEPDELVGTTEAARVLGYSRTLPEYVLHLADDESVGTQGRVRRRWKRRTLWQILDETAPPTE